MLERLNKCPLCKSGLFLHHAKVLDHALSKESFILCKCSSCGLIFTNPRPSEATIGDYYKSSNYVSHQNQSNNLTNFIYKKVRYFTLRKKISLLNSYQKKKGKLLDIGSGTGHFLEVARNSGWEITGVEPNSDARKIAKSKSIDSYDSVNSLDKKSKFEGITLFHVLEHIHELRKIGKTLFQLLKKNGVLFIAVPNYNSQDSLTYKQDWASLDVPRHLYHFTNQSMLYFAEEFNFKIIDKKPMIFDSYYVSILSEGYKNPKRLKLLNYIAALKSGFTSNRKARQNDVNYSSILYVLKKNDK